jgi:hypothetical protein
MSALLRMTLVVAFGVSGSVQSGAFEKRADGAEMTFWWYKTTCGQYAEDRRLPRNDGQHASDAAYIAGWLSAYNALMPGGNLRGDSVPDDAMLWLDHYCANNPFLTIQDGFLEFNHRIAPTLMRN